MKTTAILLEEHRLVGRFIIAVEAAASQLERGSGRGPEFFREPADLTAGRQSWTAGNVLKLSKSDSSARRAVIELAGRYAAPLRQHSIGIRVD